MAEGYRKSPTRDTLESLVVTVILAVFGTTFVVQAFKIPSGSMKETLQVGDHILVNKFVYTFTAPGRGDVIVFKFPQDESRDFVKRVIGLAGETLEIREGRVSVDGKPFEEPYAVHLDGGGRGDGRRSRESFGPVKVPEGHLFVMGDNRDSSQDSRYWGFLNAQKIRGRAFMVYFSWRSDPDGPQWWPVRIAYMLARIPWNVRWNRIGKIVR